MPGPTTSACSTAPPGIGRLVANALVAAGVVVCPVSLSSTSIRGVQRLRTLVGTAEAALGEAPRVLYLPTVADARLRETRELLGVLREGFGVFPEGALLPPIRYSAALSRAFGLGRTIVEHEPEGRAAEDYGRLFEALAAGGVVPAAEIVAK